MDILALFGENLKQLRDKAELTQEQLAEAIDVIPQHLSDIERGKYGVNFRRLPKLAKALGVPIPELFAFPEEPDL